MNDQGEELLTPQEVAKALKVSRKAVYNWLRRGRLRGVKLGGWKASLWRVPKKSLEEFIRKRNGD